MNYLESNEKQAEWRDECKTNDVSDFTDKYSFSQQFLTALILKDDAKVIEIAKEYVYKTIGRITP